MSTHDDLSTDTLVGISFGDLFRAQEFLTAVTRLASKDELKLKDAVIVVKSAEGKTTVHETIDPQPARTAASGAVWAGLFGLLLGGPVGWVAGAALGAAAGLATAELVDLGISDDWVAWFRESVQPGTATLALLLSGVDRDALVAEAARFSGAHLVYSNLDASTMDRVKEALGGSAG